MSETKSETKSDMDRINSLVNKLNRQIPRNTDMLTTHARLEHTGLNARSINMQTIFLSILIVIFVTITFAVHLTE